MYIFVCFLGSQTVYFNDFQTFNLTCASGTITIEDARWYAQKIGTLAPVLLLQYNAFVHLQGLPTVAVA